MDFVGIGIRWLHIASVVLLIGAALYGSQTRTALAESFRSRIYLGLALVVLSGFYQFFAKMSTGFAKGYHMWFGIKMLFALHILAVYLLIALGRGDEAKQRRWLHGIAGSGLIAIFLGTVIAHMA